jgi:hypothetical protein
VLAPADLTQPIGDLSADLFPVLDGEPYADADEKLDTLLQGWIRAGLNALAGTPAEGSEPALAHFVYGRAKRSVYSRLLANPTSASVERHGSHSYTQKQVDAWGDQADRHDAAVALALSPPPAVVFSRPSSSGSFPTRTIW